MNFKDFFGCEYPIVAAPMNKVSDVDLAVACHRAGIFPSLSIYNYIETHSLEKAIDTFQSKTGSNKILLSLDSQEFLDKDVQELILKLKISHLEILGDNNITQSSTWDEFLRDSKALQKEGVKILLKSLDSNNVSSELDGVILKSNTGAGRGVEWIDIDYALLSIARRYPAVPIIMSGGISKPRDVKKYLNMGCMAVAIGTLLAASEESCVSLETKQQMVNATYENITRLKNARQNALVFSEITIDDDNNTNALVKGIASPAEGHIFAGKGINEITSIKSVKNIVEDLIKDLVF
jgi:NAD(P)H-dependent flavin oxidoreductase YrpB (nitropropane dioxygenase family)